MQRDAGTLRVLDHRADIEGCLFALSCQFDGTFHCQMPRMVDIEFHWRLGQQFLLGQTGARVLGGKAGNGNRRRNGVAQGLARKIRCAGVTTTLADIGRHADALVAVVLDGIDFLTAHRNRLAEALGNIDLARGCSRRGGVIEYFLGKLAQRLLGVAEF